MIRFRKYGPGTEEFLKGSDREKAMIFRIGMRNKEKK